MAKRNVEVFLNAYDNTAASTQSAADNVAGYADSIVASNQAVESSFQAVGQAADTGIVSAMASIASAALPAIVAVGAVAAGAYLVYQNWEPIAGFFRSVGESIAASMLALWENIGTAGYTALATIEYAFMNWRDVAELVLVGIQYRVVQTFNEMVYMLTEVIPGYLQWFWENWRDIFKTIYDYVSTVVMNMHENLVRFFTAIIEWMQGNGFNFEWVALTEGFESSIKKLPEIAERELGPLEQDLKERFEAIGSKVGDGLGSHIAKRLADIPGFKKDIADFFGGIGDRIKNFLSPNLNVQAQSSTPTLADGESSRFLSGVGAESRERMQIEQLSLTRQIAEDAKETRNINQGIKSFLGGDLFGSVKAVAEGVKGVDL
jgi:hypothetical protein